MVVMGDSYPAGGGVGSVAYAYPQIIADYLGIPNTVNTSIGGCGYNAADCTSGSALSRIGDVTAANPNVLLVSNGTNDTSGWTPTQIAAAQTTWLATLRSNAPYANIPIFVLGIYAHTNNGASCATCVAAENAEATAIANNAANDPNTHFCRWVTDPAGSWETGTGTIATPNGTGNTDWIYTAANHNNALGNRMFAARALSCIRSVLNAAVY
jgi:lysophospholipase L1-like esterase